MRTSVASATSASLVEERARFSAAGGYGDDKPVRLDDDEGP
jgi:hypothetical protein